MEISFNQKEKIRLVLMDLCQRAGGIDMLLVNNAWNEIEDIFKGIVKENISIPDYDTPLIGANMQGGY